MTWEADTCRIEEASDRTSHGAIGLGSWARARNGGGMSPAQSRICMLLKHQSGGNWMFETEVVECMRCCLYQLCLLFIVFEIYHVIHAAAPH